MKTSDIIKELHTKFPKKDGWKFKIRKNYDDNFKIFILRGPYTMLNPNRSSYGPIRIKTLFSELIYADHIEKVIEMVETIRDMEDKFDCQISIFQGLDNGKQEFKLYGTLEDKMMLI